MLITFATDTYADITPLENSFNEWHGWL